MNGLQASAPLPETEVKDPRHSALWEVYDWIEIFVLSISIVFLLFTFGVRIAVVDGESMTYTLSDHDTLAVTRLFYTPKQGDIVVFQAPKRGFEEPLVKRVIATEGQTVSIDFDTWEIRVDGVLLHEPYIRHEGGRLHGWYYEGGTAESYTVPEGCVFVMGDNRNDSTDSRHYSVGPVDTRYIIGKVICRLTPISHFGPVA